MVLNKENYDLLKEQGLKRSEIADRFSIPEWKLKKHIAAHRWGKELPYIEFEDVFEQLDEHACYWGGFLAADGNVDCKKRVRLTLNYDDLAHVQKYKDLLGSTHTLGINTDPYYRCSLEFTNEKIWADLRDNFNIIPNKTDCLKFPSQLNTEQLRHYIRGYFDGDGSVCESFSNRNSLTATLYATFASGSIGFSTELYAYLTKLLGLQGTLQHFEAKQQIKFCTNDAKILLRWMYEDAEIYLDRKYLKYIRIVVENNRTTRLLDKGIVQSS